MRILARLSCLTAVLTACASCAVLFPTEPEAVPVGLTRDGNVLVVHLPLCSEYQVERVEVTPSIEEGYDSRESHWWIGDDYVGDPKEGIRLDPVDWRSAQDVAVDWSRGFSVDVWTGDLRAGTVVYEDEAHLLNALGDDLFAEGEVMSMEIFLQEFGKDGCKSIG